MDCSFSQKAKEATRASLWTSKSKENKDHYYGIQCPQCKAPEAFFYFDNPGTIHCHRGNECAKKTLMRDQFPELYNFEKSFPVTESDPYAPAKSYLQSRGFEAETMRGVQFEHWSNIRNTGSGGIMFFVGINAKGEEVWNGRQYNPPKNEGKTHNVGESRGLIWTPPGIQKDQPVYFCEAILEALSLRQLGLQAVSVLSASANPENFDISEYSRPIIAFNNDPAGIKGLRRWKKHFPQVSGILPPKGKDWNDILCSDKPESVKKYFDENFPLFETWAKLAMAETAEQYGIIYHEFFKHSCGLFEFKQCYYHSSAKETKHGIAIRTIICSNFTLKVEHFQLNLEVADRPEFKYYITLKLETGKKYSFECSGTELSDPKKLRELFLNRAMGSWSGDLSASVALVKRIVETDSPIVRQLQKVGYDRQSDCYTHASFCINSSGECIIPNDSGFFKVSDTAFLRPLKGFKYDNILPKKVLDLSEIYLLLCDAWPQRSEVAMAWMVGSWFVNQIKDRIGFFPFLSFYGDTQTGKTKLCLFLNRMQGFNYEGNPINEINTPAGLARTLSKLSGHFTSLLESKGQHQVSKAFDVNSILPLYNQNPIQIRAEKSNDNKTIEIPFLTSLLFAQNDEPFITKAQKERVISLKFNTSQLNRYTTQAAEELTILDPSTLAFFFTGIMKHRKEIESTWFDQYTLARKELKEEIQDARICENHSLLLAFYRIVQDIIKKETSGAVITLEADFKRYVVKIGKKKINAVNSRLENPGDVLLDWCINTDLGLYDDNNKCYRKNYIDISKEDKKLYLHLKGAMTAIRDRGPNFYYADGIVQVDLQNHPGFIENDASHRFKERLIKPSQKAYVFNIDKLGIIDQVAEAEKEIKEAEAKKAANTE